MTDGAEALNDVAGGELGPGRVEEGAMFSNGEEIINGDDE